MTYQTGEAEFVGTYMSAVEDETVSWISPGRLARSHVTMLDGDPGLGKSTLMADWAARITTGARFPGNPPDHHTTPGGVVFLSAEDHLAQTLKPRLQAVGADLSRVLFMRGVAEPFTDSLRPISFPSDLGRLKLAIHDSHAKLVVIDPLMVYLDDNLDSHRDQSVRKAMMPLQRLAEETKVAVVCIRHLSKMSGGPALYRGSGSIGISAAARIGLLVGQNPDVDGGLVLATYKINAGVLPQSLGFRIVAAENNPSAGRVEYSGYVNISADDLAGYLTLDEREERAMAKVFVSDLLRNGPTPVRELYGISQRGGFDKAITKAALRSAGAYRDRVRGQLCWCLPGLAGYTEIRRPTDATPTTLGQAAFSMAPVF